MAALERPRLRLLAAAPVANLTPGVSVRKTTNSWSPTREMIDGKKGVMVICNHRSYMDPFALASALLPLEIAAQAALESVNATTRRGRT